MMNGRLRRSLLHAEAVLGADAQNRLAEIEPTTEAEAEWVAHNLDVAGHHLRSSCSSWYTGENIAGKPKVFMPYIGGFPRYVDRCDEIAASGYEGFRVA